MNSQNNLIHCLCSFADKRKRFSWAAILLTWLQLLFYGQQIFAQQLGWPRETAGHVLASPLLFDLNGDGRLEILVTSFDDKIYVYNHDGTTFDPGGAPWPKTLGYSDGSIGSLAVGDVDGDGNPEIVVAGDNSLATGATLKVYEVDGTLLGQFALLSTASAKSTPCVIDCRKYIGSTPHPAEEILIRDGDGRLHVIHWTGSALATTATIDTVADNTLKDRFGSQPITSSAAAVDLGNGTTMFAVGSTDDRVYAWTATSTSVNNWNATALSIPAASESTQFLSSPVISDLDGDQEYEIICGSVSGKVFVWNEDGTLRSGWPRMSSAAVISSAACADIDGGGDLEILIGCDDGTIYVYRNDGSPPSGWSDSLLLGTLGDVFASPVAAEIDGQPGLEILAASFDRHLYAWDKNGDLLSGWPRRMNTLLFSTPAVGDIHAGGRMAVITAGYDGRVFVFDLEHKSLNVSAGWRQFRGGPRRRGTGE